MKNIDFSPKVSFEYRMKSRFVFVMMLFCLFLTFLTFRLSDLMLFNHFSEDKIETLSERIYNVQHKSSANAKEKLPLYIIKTRQVSPVAMPRGNIYDCNYNRLAFSVLKKALYLNKIKIEKDSNARAVLANILGIPEKELKELFNSTRQSWVKLAADLENDAYLKEVESRLKNYASDFSLQNYYKRVYPYNNLLSHVLGFVSVDNVGLSGLEESYDDILSGRTMKNKIFKEPMGILFYNKKVLSSFAGTNIVLTIDKKIQEIVEDEALKAYDELGSKNITVIASRPKTGEILAMANKPDFNLNDANSEAKKIAEEKKNNPSCINPMRNFAINDWYEPGSTMKVVTASILTEKGLVNDNMTFECIGRYRIGNIHTYKCYNKEVHGTLKFVNVLEHSCNSGIIQSMLKMPVKDYYQSLINFGFGITTSSDLANERTGKLSSYEKWSGLSKYSIAIGQEITVTALQMLNSLIVVPNGGYLLKPTFVKEIRDERDQIVEKIKVPQIIRQVISQTTAEKVKGYLVSVVENGTGKNAKINGINIGGKTGTAQLVEDKKYSSDLSAASFFGFFPAEDPKIAILVVVNQATKKISGGMTAAPLFKKIAMRILEEQGEYFPADLVKLVVDVKNKKKYGDSTSIYKDDLTIKTSAKLQNKTEHFSEHNTMPDLQAKSKRECMSILSEKISDLNLDVKIEGSGFLFYQSVKPKEELKNNTEIVLKFK